MILKVIRKLESSYNLWECKDEQGKLHRVDLLAGSTLRQDVLNGIVGKTIAADSLTPYVEIAQNPEIIPALPPDEPSSEPA